MLSFLYVIFIGRGGKNPGQGSEGYERRSLIVGSERTPGNLDTVFQNQDFDFFRPSEALIICQEYIGLGMNGRSDLNVDGLRRGYFPRNLPAFSAMSSEISKRLMFEPYRGWPSI